MNRMHVSVVLVWALFVVAGCEVGNEDDPSGAGTVELKVPEETLGSEMGVDEAGDLCVAIYNAMVQTRDNAIKITDELICQNTGYYAGGEEAALDGSDDDIVSACKKAVSDCEKEGSQEIDNGEEEVTPEEACEDVTDDIRDCDATAGEMADCFNLISEKKLELTRMEVEDTNLPECEDLSAVYFKKLNTTAPPDDNGSETEMTMPKICQTLFDACHRLGRLVPF